MLGRYMGDTRDMHGTCMGDTWEMAELGFLYSLNLPPGERNDLVSFRVRKLLKQRGSQADARRIKWAIDKVSTC